MGPLSRLARWACSAPGVEVHLRVSLGSGAGSGGATRRARGDRPGPDGEPIGAALREGAREACAARPSGYHRKPLAKHRLSGDLSTGYVGTVCPPPCPPPEHVPSTISRAPCPSRIDGERGFRESPHEVALWYGSRGGRGVAGPSGGAQGTLARGIARAQVSGSAAHMVATRHQRGRWEWGGAGAGLARSAGLVTTPRQSTDSGVSVCDRMWHNPGPPGTTPAV